MVTNTGDVTLDPVGVDDPKVGAVTCPVTTLAPGAATTCTATYTVTQADVDAGPVDNTATASGTPPTGAASTRHRLHQRRRSPPGPAVSLSKTAGPIVTSTATAASTPATPSRYSFVVTNTGTSR